MKAYICYMVSKDVLNSNSIIQTYHSIVDRNGNLLVDNWYPLDEISNVAGIMGFRMVISASPNLTLKRPKNGES